MSEENTSTGRTGSAAESMRMSYAHARDAAQQMYDQVRGQAGDYFEKGKSKASDYRQQMEEVVRDKPLRSVLIAAGAGLVIGMLLRRM